MNDRPLSIFLLACISAAGLALAGCHQKRASPGEQMKQGAEQMGAGAVKAASHAGQVVADAAITTKVRTQLATDDELTGSNIRVDTINGIVTLSGTVTSTALRRRAGKIAENTDGVKGVTNDIKIVGKG